VQDDVDLLVLSGCDHRKEHDMRIPVFPIISSVLLLTSPAFAQQAGTTTAQPTGTSTSSNLPDDTKVTLDTQQKLRQSLVDSGFKNVKVTAETYVVHAKAPDGSHIVMMVSPDQIAGVIEHTGSSSPPRGSMQTNPSTSESGDSTSR
jgi:hypothetical protein